HDAVLAALPFFHSYGLLAMVLTGLIAAKLVPVPNPRDIHLILEISQEEKPTFFPGVPRLYVAINEFPDVHTFDLKSVKACVSGAAPLPQAGAQVMVGQWARREETALAIRHGSFHTGDVAVMEPGGFFRIVDRLKGMVLVSGINVYPNQVEYALYHHPASSKCALVGVPDDRA